MLLPYRNLSFDLYCKPFDWFLYYGNIGRLWNNARKHDYSLSIMGNTCFTADFKSKLKTNLEQQGFEIFFQNKLWMLEL